MNIARIRLLALAAICASFLFRAGAQSADHAFLSSSVTAEQVSNVVKQGVSREAVIQVFGKPFSHEKISNQVGEDFYPMGMPTRLANFKEGFSGFEVRYQGDRVVNWSPITAGPLVLRTNQTPLESIAGTTNIANIAFHIVYEDLPGSMPGWRYIDTPAFPHLGSIRTNADLVAQNISRVEMTESILLPATAGKEYEVNIHLSDSQTNAFANLMARHSGKRMMIMIGGEPVAAPYIMEPISDGLVAITFRQKKDAEEIVRRLSKPHPPDQS